MRPGRVLPVKFRYYSDALSVTVLAGGGYRANCPDCAWRSKSRHTYARAMGELQDHRHKLHGGAAA